MIVFNAICILDVVQWSIRVLDTYMKSEDNFFIAHDGVWDGERMIKERI